MSLIIIKKRSEKTVDSCPFLLGYVPNCCKTQEIFEKAICKESIVLNMVSINVSLKECVTAVDACLSVKKFVLDWFVMNKKLEKLDFYFLMVESLLMQILIILHF